jgi:hypothetical protein
VLGVQRQLADTLALVYRSEIELQRLSSDVIAAGGNGWSWATIP